MRKILMFSPLLLLAAAVACGSPPLHPATQQQAQRIPQPIENDPLCVAVLVDTGIWARTCRLGCLPLLRPPLLCHDNETPHAVLPYDIPDSDETTNWVAALDPTACDGSAWRVYRVKAELRPADALDMNVAASWLAATADCPDRPAATDPEFFKNNPAKYYRTIEVIPLE